LLSIEKIVKELQKSTRNISNKETKPLQDVKLYAENGKLIESFYAVYLSYRGNNIYNIYIKEDGNLMFEFIDIQMITASALALFLLSVMKLKYKKIILLGVALLYLLIIGVSVMDSYQTLEENIKSFKRGAVLKCSSKVQEYQVSLDNGWRVKKHYFTKESLLVSATKCEIFK